MVTFSMEDYFTLSVMLDSLCLSHDICSLPISVSQDADMNGPQQWALLAGSQ